MGSHSPSVAGAQPAPAPRDKPSPGARDTITFLGTAGARFVVTKQLLASGGMWLNLSGSEMLLDPGPGSLVQAIKRKLDPARLKAIILSHKHIDHSGDVNIMIEAMTEGGFKKRGMLLVPGDALEGNDPIIFRYLRGFVERIETLRQGDSYVIGEATVEARLRLHHPVETYGLVFRTPRYTVSYIADTRFFDELAGHFKADLLIINVVRLEPGSQYDHLSIPEVGTIVNALRPRVAIMTHFGMTVWRARPWELASQLSQQTGIKVLAARDGMRFDLSLLGSAETIDQ